MKAASSCEPIEVEMCQGLSYNLTSFPNIWLSIADQREAAALLRQYRVRHMQAHDAVTVSAPADLSPPPPTPVPGVDGAGVLRAPAEAGVWDVSAPVQPPGRRPPALPLRVFFG